LVEAFNYGKFAINEKEVKRKEEDGVVRLEFENSSELRFVKNHENCKNVLMQHLDLPQSENCREMLMLRV